MRAGPLVVAIFSRLAISLALIAVLLFSQTVVAAPAGLRSRRPQPKPLAPNKADTSRAARADAIKSLPLDQLSAAARKKVVDVVNKASVFRRSPVHVGTCDPEMYLFLLRHPDVLVNIWEVMGISNVALKRTGKATFRAADGAGTLCNVEYLFGDQKKHVIYAEGSYEGPVFKKPIRAKCVLIVRSGYIRSPDGQIHVTSRLDTFIKIENLAVELLVKTFQPMVGAASDTNFSETAAFISRVSRTAERNPAGMRRLAEKLSKLTPEVREKFAGLSIKVGERAVQRRQQATTRQVSKK